MPYKLSQGPTNTPAQISAFTNHHTQKLHEVWNESLSRVWHRSEQVQGLRMDPKALRREQLSVDEMHQAIDGSPPQSPGGTSQRSNANSPYHKSTVRSSPVRKRPRIVFISKARQPQDVSPEQSQGDPSSRSNTASYCQKSSMIASAKRKHPKIVFINKIRQASEVSPERSSDSASSRSQTNSPSSTSPARTSPKEKRIKIVFTTKYRACWSPELTKIIEKKRKALEDVEYDVYEDIEDDNQDEALDLCQADSLNSANPSTQPRQTRSSKSTQHFFLEQHTRPRRPKLYPSNTPWGNDWNYHWRNDLYPDSPVYFNWDGGDIPDFDLGEPLDEVNYWEKSWIEAREEKKKAREASRKRQKRKGGLCLTRAGRKRAYKKRMTEKGM